MLLLERVKKFVFQFTTVCAKWTRTARSWWLNLYTGMPYDKLSFGQIHFFEAFEFQSPMRKGALCLNLNVFGFLSCRYAYAHDKNLKNIRKNFFVQNKRKCLKTALEYQRVTKAGRVVKIPLSPQQSPVSLLIYRTFYFIRLSSPSNLTLTLQRKISFSRHPRYPPCNSDHKCGTVHAWGASVTSAAGRETLFTSLADNERQALSLIHI